MSRAKNNGEVLTTTTRGTLEALPALLRAALEVVVTRQPVNLDGTPATLTDGVLQSSTTQEVTTERVKEVITAANFPITLTSSARTDEFGGGTVTITDTFSLIEPTAPAGSLIIINHDIRNLGKIYWEHKEEKTTESWPTLDGQQYLDELDIIIQFTETYNVPGANIGDARTEVTPLDDKRQRVRVWAVNTSALAAYSRKYAGTEDVQLPDELVSVTAVMNSVEGNSTATQSATDQFFEIINNGSGSLSPSSRSTASASIVPDLQVVRRQFWGQDIPVTYVSFFQPEASCTSAEILARATTIMAATVNAWPVFKPESVTFTLLGQQVSVSASADTQASLAVSLGAFSAIESSTKAYQKGSGNSLEAGVTSRFVEIPPTLHGTISVGGETSRSRTPSVTVSANTTPLYIGVTPVVAGITNEPASVTKTITASVSPTSLSATSPTEVPKTGLYARRIEIESYRWAYNQVRVTIIDCSIFA